MLDHRAGLFQAAKDIGVAELRAKPYALVPPNYAAATDRYRRARTS